jgi:hypothetical protein
MNLRPVERAAKTRGKWGRYFPDLNRESSLQREGRGKAWDAELSKSTHFSELLS